MLKKTVVILEDNEQIKEELKRVLDDSFLIVGETNDGKEGVEICKGLNPDFLISNFFLAGADGLWVLDKINQNGLDTKTIMLINCYKEELIDKGMRPGGVRIDSGDITYLTKKIRAELDKNGMPDCKITATNSLDEYIIRDLLSQGAPIDTFGVGERMITSSSDPVFGGVYKLASVYDGAHKLGAFHHLPHGVANALLINEVLKFNSVDVPTKMGTFSQYAYPHTLERYAEVADYLGLGGNTSEEKLNNLINKINELKAHVGIK